MCKVRAKFECVGIDDQPEQEGKNISFSAVINDCEENKSFSKYTPSGNLTMFVSYETEAVNSFKEGKEYFLDFTLAE